VCVQGGSPHEIQRSQAFVCALAAIHVLCSADAAAAKARWLYGSATSARSLCFHLAKLLQFICTFQIANFIFIIFTNALVWYFWGARSVAYMVGSTLIGMSLHPVSGHLIAEHFEYTSGQVCARFSLHRGLSGLHPACF
jgi:Na+/alanine symporter